MSPAFRRANRPADAELILERYAATSQQVSAASPFPVRRTATPKSQRPTAVAGCFGLADQRRRRHGAAVRGPGPREFQIRLRARRQSASERAGGPPRLRQTHPRLGQCRRFSFAARFQKPGRRLRPARRRSGSLSPTPATGARWKSNCAPKCSKAENTTVFQFSRPTAERAIGKQLPADADVRLTVRFDIEDRNFHWETKRNGGADHHFSSNTRALPGPGPGSRDPSCGFAFTPAPDRQLRVFADAGEYHPQPEWCENIPHPVEQSRGQTGSGDAYSPGWFELPLPKGASVTLVATAESRTRSESRLQAETAG